MNPNSPMRRFDPRKAAHLEKENYVAYYQKDWLKLLRVSVGLVKESFGLNLWQAIYDACLVARAEIAFAPFPDNDIPRAQAYMRRSYQFIRQIHHVSFDVEQAARLESTGGSSTANCSATNPVSGLHLNSALSFVQRQPISLTVEPVSAKAIVNK